MAAGNKGMRDLMKNGVYDFARFIQIRQRARKRNTLLRRPATPKPPSRVIEAKLPIGQAMLIHKLSGHRGRLL
jgi:hypothetical protein